MFDKLVEISNGPISFIMNPHFEGVLLYIRIVFIILSVLMIMATVILLFWSSWSKRFIVEDLIESIAARPYGAKEALKQWARIKNRIENGRPDDQKLALIEADALLDETLKNMGYQGESIADRLKQINSTILPNLNDVLEARKIRNNIVYDPDYQLTPDLAKQTSDIYQKALQDLEAF